MDGVDIMKYDKAANLLQWRKNLIIDIQENEEKILINNQIFFRKKKDELIKRKG